jgi:sugar lactone lactonase YvrE
MPPAASILASTLAAALASTLAACHHDARTAAPAAGEPDVEVAGLAKPESVLWDAEHDVYLVSNIGPGKPFEAEDDGAIARVSPAGELLEPLVTGAAGDTRLDSPRGLALRDGVLYVADLQVVRAFDATTGAARGAWPVAGAVMLNDLVLADDGALFVSDSGLPPALQPAGARHAVYRLDVATPGAAAIPVIIGDDLGRPNGLAFAGDALWVATYGSGELYRACGHDVCDRERLPQGGLDGIVVLPDGSFLISSWDASAVYRGRPGGPWTVAVDGVAGAADLGWDSRRGRLLLPLLEAGALAARTLPPPAAPTR